MRMKNKGFLLDKKATTLDLDFYRPFENPDRSCKNPNLPAWPMWVDDKRVKIPCCLSSSLLTAWAVAVLQVLNKRNTRANGYFISFRPPRWPSRSWKHTRYVDLQAKETFKTEQENRSIVQLRHHWSTENNPQFIFILSSALPKSLQNSRRTRKPRGRQWKQRQ